MDPTVSAVMDFLEWLQDEFHRGLAGRPAGALNWRPYPDANTIAGLVAHSFHTSDAQLRWSLGPPTTQEEQRAAEEAAEAAAEQFAATAPDAGALLRRVDQGFDGLRAVLRDYTPEVLATPRESKGYQISGAVTLVLMCGHLREHWGQIQMTRDLYHARGAG